MVDLASLTKHKVAVTSPNLTSMCRTSLFSKTGLKATFLIGRNDKSMQTHGCLKSDCISGARSSTGPEHLNPACNNHVPTSNRNHGNSAQYVKRGRCSKRIFSDLNRCNSVQTILTFLVPPDMWNDQNQLIRATLTFHFDLYETQVTGIFFLNFFYLFKNISTAISDSRRWRIHTIESKFHPFQVWKLWNNTGIIRTKRIMITFSLIYENHHASIHSIFYRTANPINK